MGHRSWGNVPFRDRWPTLVQGLLLPTVICPEQRIPIVCAMGRLDFWQGTATLTKTLLDTQKSVLDVQGQVALQSQVVNVQVKAHPKSFDLLDLHGPVIIEGKLCSPNVSIVRSIPIPTPVFGNAKNVDCAGLTT